MFERIHNTEEQIYFYERAENHRQKSGCLNHVNERIFQVLHSDAGVNQ